MRLTLDSTDDAGTIVVDGAQVPARFWIGTTEQGNRVAAFITRIAPLDRAAAIELELSLFDFTAQTNTVIEGEPAKADDDWQVMTEPGINMDELVQGRRVEQAYQWHQLVIDGQKAWIEPRPAYCNRGRYIAQYDGSFFIDGGDSFPRYYMDLETAKREMKAWLLHRIKCERRDA
jgi:hypothetical protein